MMIQPGRVYSCTFSSWKENLSMLLDRAGLPDHLDRRPVLLKPNLVEAIEPPVTTPVELVAALIDYLRSRTTNQILIGEGCGALAYATGHAFDCLGYTRLAAEKQVDLIDLNHEPCRRLRRPDCSRWPELYLPGIALDCFLISLPVLKAHTLAGVTLGLKNMMGLVPPSHYRQGNSWKKSAFHHGIQEAIADLNRYRSPDFTILDASVGMAEAHLWGPPCDPPVGKLLAGYDPVAVDACGTGLLGRSWQRIGHIRQLDRELGRADPLEIVLVNDPGAPGKS